MGSCFRRNDSVVIARSEATKQSIFDLAMPSDGLLRSARNDDDGAHHSLVVPAHAGTHNHKRFLEQKLSATVPKREAAKYGSLLSQERQRRHVWTAPCRQGFFGVSANGSGSGHVYGLEMRPVAAGPDGERGSNSNHCGALLRAMTARSVSIPVS